MQSGYFIVTETEFQATQQKLDKYLHNWLIKGMNVAEPGREFPEFLHKVTTGYVDPDYVERKILMVQWAISAFFLNLHHVNNCLVTRNLEVSLEEFNHIIENINDRFKELRTKESFLSAIPKINNMIAELHKINMTYENPLNSEIYGLMAMIRTLNHMRNLETPNIQHRPLLTMGRHGAQIEVFKLELFEQQQIVHTVFIIHNGLNISNGYTARQNDNYLHLAKYKIQELCGDLCRLSLKPDDLLNKLYDLVDVTLSGIRLEGSCKEETSMIEKASCDFIEHLTKLYLALLNVNRNNDYHTTPFLNCFERIDTMFSRELSTYNSTIENAAVINKAFNNINETAIALLSVFNVTQVEIHKFREFADMMFNLISERNNHSQCRTYMAKTLDLQQINVMSPPERNNTSENDWRGSFKTMSRTRYPLLTR